MVRLVRPLRGRPRAAHPGPLRRPRPTGPDGVPGVAPRAQRRLRVAPRHRPGRRGPRGDAARVPRAARPSRCSRTCPTGTGRLGPLFRSEALGTLLRSSPHTPSRTVTAGPWAPSWDGSTFGNSAPGSSRLARSRTWRSSCSTPTTGSWPGTAGSVASPGPRRFLIPADAERAAARSHVRVRRDSRRGRRRSPGSRFRPLGGPLPGFIVATLARGRRLRRSRFFPQEPPRRGRSARPLRGGTERRARPPDAPPDRPPLRGRPQDERRGPRRPPSRRRS